MDEILRFPVIGYSDSEIDVRGKTRSRTRGDRQPPDDRPPRTKRVQVIGGLLEYLLNLGHGNLLYERPG